MGKRWVAKSLKKEEERMQNHTISKKIGGKSAIEHKDGLQNRTISDRGKKCN